MNERHQLHQSLKANIAMLRNKLKENNINVINHPDSPVVCIEDFPYKTTIIVDKAQRNGCSLVVSGHPAVPRFHNSIIRICCSALHTSDDYDFLLANLVRKTNTRFCLKYREKLRDMRLINEEQTRGGFTIKHIEPRVRVPVPCRQCKAQR
jgi:hypothetical protein